MRRIAALTLTLTLACSAIPVSAQQKPGPEPARGSVVVGREAGQKDKEWAFALDPATRIDAGGKMKAANELREGDAVTVTYTNRDGKIVAQSVKVNAP